MRPAQYVLPALFVVAAVAAPATGQINNYYGTSGSLSGSVFSTNPGGTPPTGVYNQAFAADANGGVLNFGNATTGQPSGNNTRVVAGINATANVTFANTGLSGTISNFNNRVIAIDVASGVTLDFMAQSFTASGTAGYIKNGGGVLATAGNTYGGGFTLNAGTVLLRGVNGMGGGASNTLTINGGIIASNAGRNLTGKFSNGITVGGDFQLGANSGLASSVAGLVFSNDMSLGSADRTITLGNNATMSLNGAIGGDAGVGVTFAATSPTTTGKFVLGGANTYTGGTTISGGTVVVNGSLSANSAPSAQVTVADGATLGGIGTVARNVTVGGTLAPGNSDSIFTTLGTLTTGVTTFAGGGSYAWEFLSNDPGVGYDTVSAAGLDIAATTGSKFNILLKSMADSTNRGDNPNFDLTTARSYLLVASDTEINNFSVDKFAIDTSGFTIGGEQVSVSLFSVALSGNNLVLNFNPIPEPGTVLAVAAVGLGLGRVVRRRRG